MAPLPRLNRALVCSGALHGRGLELPTGEMLNLPERAVQFGTGALLRGFVEHFIDVANERGLFDGRIVVVSSTGSGRDAALLEQEGLYTLVVRGVEDGATVDRRRVISSISHALSARDEWGEVLACARSPELQLVFSNTTEVGITLDEGDDPELAPPRSFPGKLTRFLYERARAFGFDRARGVVVIPCELIERNGERLREIVLALAGRWKLGAEFVRWVEGSVPFCNTLVDRIVPGAPDAETAAALREELGYDDRMTTVCEPYRLFAIEARGATREQLRFTAADPGIVVADDIAPYRERKVRLLNGAHTASVSLALLEGCETVREALEDERVGSFVREVLLEEILPTVDAPGAAEFARAVLDRFRNPYIRHALFDITLQGTMKLRVRVVPSIVRYGERFGRAPRLLARGFAAFLLFQRGDLQRARREAGLPVPADDQAEPLRALWRNGVTDATIVARAACADAELWGTDLTRVPGFADAVASALDELMSRHLQPSEHS